MFTKLDVAKLSNTQNLNLYADMKAGYTNNEGPLGIMKILSGTQGRQLLREKKQVSLKLFNHRSFLIIGKLRQGYTRNQISDDIVAAVIFESATDIRSGDVDVQCLDISDGGHLVLHSLQRYGITSCPARLTIYSLGVRFFINTGPSLFSNS